MRFKIVLPVLGAALLVSYFAWAQISSRTGEQKVSYTPSQKECFAFGEAKPWRACVHKPTQGGVNGNIAYLFHGRNLDENIWNDDTFYTALIQQYWSEHKLTPPTVVTVSFGPVWLLTPKGKLEKSGLLEVVTNEVIPEVERRIGAPKKRIVFGESMGGVNALILGLSKGSLFQRVASLCPAIYKGSPFQSLEEIQEFVKRTGADPKIIFGIVQLSKEYFADDDEWKRSSPVHMIEQADVKEAPEYYLSCGLYDAYGNFEGNEFLAQRGAKLGFQIAWRPIYGGHCATDISSIAEFLVK